jgi:hypothetical protein
VDSYPLQPFAHVDASFGLRAPGSLTVIPMRAFLLLFCCIHLATGFVSSACMRRVLTEMRGGYDATVGTDPSTPIQFFTLPGCTCPYAQRVHIALLELLLPFDMTETSLPKPDWYLKINPVSSIADGLIFLSLFWGIV